MTHLNHLVKKPLSQPVSRHLTFSKPPPPPINHHFQVIRNLKGSSPLQIITSTTFENLHHQLYTIPTMDRWEIIKGIHENLCQPRS
jgi:hypothetical protein